MSIREKTPASLLRQFNVDNAVLFRKIVFHLISGLGFAAVADYW
jgi:hypothetical protein